MLPKNNHVVIYNTEEQVGMCPNYVFRDKKLWPCVHTNVVMTRKELRDLFYLWDLDHIDNTNKYGEAILEILNQELLKDTPKNNKVLHINEE